MRMLRKISQTKSYSRAGEKSSIGGGGGNRTHDIQLAKLALSQLSYTPIRATHQPVTRAGYAADMVGLGRLELPTSRLSGVRSNHLSYRPTLACLFCLIRRRASLFAPVEYA